MPGRYPPVKPFLFSYRLADFSFPDGIASAFATARAGAFGIVLVGKLNEDDTPVAVKIIFAENTTREMFNEEAQTLLHLRGKVDIVREIENRKLPLDEGDSGAQHVTYVYGTGVEPSLSAVDPSLPSKAAYLLVVEPLHQTLRQAFLRPEVVGFPPVGDLLRAVHQVSLGLAFMAKHRVVHSDIKPENVMLADDRRAVICDLGLARIMSAAGATSAEKYGGHGGTILYIAPELLQKPELRATLASDIYAYGHLLWCLFSGRPETWVSEDCRPPTAVQLHTVIIPGVLRGERPDISTALRPNTPSAAIDLITRCWAQNPGARPSASAIASETASWLQSVAPSIDLSIALPSGEYHILLPGGYAWDVPLMFHSHGSGVPSETYVNVFFAHGKSNQIFSVRHVDDTGITIAPWCCSGKYFLGVVRGTIRFVVKPVVWWLSRVGDDGNHFRICDATGQRIELSRAIFGLTAFASLTIGARIDSNNQIFEFVRMPTPTLAR